MLQTLIVSLLLIVLGAALCFVGYRYFLFLLPAWAFFVGFWAGSNGVATAMGGDYLSTISQWLTGLLVGGVLAVLSYMFYLFGICVVSATLGYMLVTTILIKLGLPAGFFVYLLGLVAAVLAVVAMFRFSLQKYIIIVITAIGGAITGVAGVLLLIDRITLQQLKLGVLRPVFDQSPIWLVIWLALIVAGIVVQLVTTKGYLLRSLAHD